MKRLTLRLNEVLACMALLLMVAIPLVEMVARPMIGSGFDNAPLFVQHMGLVLAMCGAVVAQRNGHLTSLGNLMKHGGNFAHLASGLICGFLTWSSWQFVTSEIASPKMLAYGIPVWWVQMVMPLGFAFLGFGLAHRVHPENLAKVVIPLLWPIAGFALAAVLDGEPTPSWPCLLVVWTALILGAPIFAVLGGVALAFFMNDGLPMASLALSQYQMTVNPSLPALPLFTLAGLLFAKTGAVHRLGAVFLSIFGQGMVGTVVAATILCSFFTAFTGGSGVTILALGGLLLPLLRNCGYPENRGISLVTSASALGVLLAPSVPLIMYAIIARVPINTMFLAGLVPAGIMVLSLLIFGGFWLKSEKAVPDLAQTVGAIPAIWMAKWEILAPVVAIGALISGLATPTESAAITAAYAMVTLALIHRELTWKSLAECLSQCAQIIGGVILILGLALGLTNYLVDAGIPDALIDGFQQITRNKYVFLLALNVFLFFAGALIEIYAAIVVLVPLLLPVAMSYGIDPVHFGIIFLANMEMGFICPPAGMNIFFASAIFKRPMRQVAVSVLPALLAIFVGTLLISWLPLLALGLPTFFNASLN